MMHTMLIKNPIFWQTTGLLVMSNLFMTFAWYGHTCELDTMDAYN